MLEDIVVHKLDEGVITVEEEKVTYFNEAAYGLYPVLEQGMNGEFLRKEFPDFAGERTTGVISFTYKKVANGGKLHYIFNAEKKQKSYTGITDNEMVGFCQLIAKESDDIVAQLEEMDKESLSRSRILIHANRLKRMSDMLHHSMDALYVEPSVTVNFYQMLDEFKSECASALVAMEVEFQVEEPEVPVLFHTKRSELQRIFFFLLSVYGAKGEKLQVTLRQSVHKVEVLLEGTKATKMGGLELHCLEELLERLEGKLEVKEENPVRLVLRFRVGRLPTQLQAGLQGKVVPLLGVNGMKSAIYLPTHEVFLANRLPDDYFYKKKEE